MLDDEAVQQLADSGFTHVRLPVNPALMLKDSELFFSRLDDALAKLARAKLIVIVDFHPGIDMPKEWADTEKQLPMAQALWTSLATHLAQTDPLQVVVEIYNEPSMDNEVWEPYLKDLFPVVRALLPDHTIIVGCGDSNNLSSLIKFHPIADDNVVYAFHFYTPIRFTHQGAHWLNDFSYKYAKAIPFPAERSPEAVDFVKTLRSRGDVSDADDLKTYLDSAYGVDDIAAALAEAGAWAKQNKKFVIMDEFGVMRKTALSKDRLLWLQAVSKAANDNGLGWTFWEHGSDFGLFTRKDGQWMIDEEAKTALGL